MWLNGLKRLWKYPKYSNKYRTKLFSYESKHKNFSPIKFTTNKMAYFDPKKNYLKKNKCLKCFWQQLTYDANKIVHKNHSNNNKLPCKTAVFGVFFIKMFNLFFPPTKIKWVHFVETVLLEYQAAKWISKEFVIHFILIYVK